MKVLRLGRNGIHREEEIDIGYRSPEAEQEFKRMRDRFAESHDTGDAFNTCTASYIDPKGFSFPSH